MRPLDVIFHRRNTAPEAHFPLLPKFWKVPQSKAHTNFGSQDDNITPSSNQERQPGPGALCWESVSLLAQTSTVKQRRHEVLAG